MTHPPKHPIILDMNLPSISESDIVPHLPALSALIDAGWKPIINVLDTVWHVGLMHVSLGTPTIMVGGGSSRSSWDGSPLNIHARSRSLSVALSDAIGEAQKVELP